MHFPQTKRQFETQMTTGLEITHAQFLVLKIRSFAPSAEYIVDPSENFSYKYDYIMGAYDDNLHLKANPNIYIERFKLCRNYQEAMQFMLGGE